MVYFIEPAIIEATTISAAERTAKSALGSYPARALPVWMTKTVTKKETMPSRIMTTNATAFSTSPERALPIN